MAVESIDRERFPELLQAEGLIRANELRAAFADLVDPS